MAKTYSVSLHYDRLFLSSCAVSNFVDCSNKLYLLKVAKYVVIINILLISSSTYP